MITLLRHITTLIAVIGTAAAAEPLPLSPSYWKDPAFLKSFNGSYRIEARIEPTVSTLERGLLVQIQTLMAAGKRTASIEKLTSSKLTADSPALTFNLATLLLEAGDLEKSAAAYRNAIAAYPSFRRAHRNLAIVLVRQEKLADALTHLIEAVRLGDTDGTTFGLLGHCRIARGEYASALQSYRFAQVTQPEVPEWKAGIAACLQETGDKKEAVALLNEVIASRPTDPGYSVLLANLHLDLSDDAAAAKALELPHRLGILSPDPTLLLADLHLRADRHPAAEAAIASAFSSEENPPSDAAIIHLVTSASALGAWETAGDLLAKTTDHSSRSVRLASARFLIASEKDPEKGEADLTVLTAEDPTDGSALLALAKRLADTDRPARAELLLERAVTDSATSYEAHISLARIHTIQARYAEALTAIDLALALRPSDSLREYRDSLAQTLAASQ